MLKMTLDTYLIKCEEYNRVSKAKPGSILGSDHLAVYRNCGYCNSTDTIRLEMVSRFIKKEELEKSIKRLEEIHCR